MRKKMSVLVSILLVAGILVSSAAHALQQPLRCPSGIQLKNNLDAAYPRLDASYSAYGILIWNETGPSVFATDNKTNYAIRQCANMLSNSGCNKLDKIAPEFNDWTVYWDARFSHDAFDESAPNYNTPGMNLPPPTLLNWAQRTLNCSISSSPQKIKDSSRDSASIFHDMLPQNATYAEHQVALRQRTQLTSVTTSVCNELIRRLRSDKGKSTGELGERWWSMLQASYRSNNNACNTVPVSFARQIESEFAAAAPKTTNSSAPKASSNSNWCDSTCQRQRTIRDNTPLRCYVSNGRRICNK